MAHDHYLDARGNQIVSESAPVELKAIVPADDAILDVAVKSPERGKIGTDAAFAFFR